MHVMPVGVGLAMSRFRLCEVIPGSPLGETIGTGTKVSHLRRDFHQIIQKYCFILEKRCHIIVP